MLFYLTNDLWNLPTNKGNIEFFHTYAIHEIFNFDYCSRCFSRYLSAQVFVGTILSVLFATQSPLK